MTGSEFGFKLGSQAPILTEPTSTMEEFPGIYWEQVGVFKVPVEARSQISLGMADQRRRLMARFDISQFDIVVMQDPKGNFVDNKILFSADTLIDDENFRKGLVKLFSSHVEEAIRAGQGGNNLPLSLIGTLGHEGFHIWQWKAIRRMVEMDLEVARLAEEKGGLKARAAAWSETQTERMARGFERDWLEHWMDYPRTANLASNLGF
jgi:hypothetical protein